MITMLENKKYIQFHETARLWRLICNSFIHASQIMILGNVIFTILGFSQRESAIPLFGTESYRVFPWVAWVGMPSYTAWQFETCNKQGELCQTCRHVLLAQITSLLQITWFHHLSLAVWENNDGSAGWIRVPEPWSEAYLESCQRPII